MSNKQNIKRREKRKPKQRNGGENNGSSPRPYTPKRDRKNSWNIDLSKSNRIPWTEKQKKLIHILTRRQKFDLEVDDAVMTKCAFIEGVAGTSKTFTAIYSAIQLLQEGKISKIYYVRSAVDSSPAKLGFLPGTLEDKMGVYQSPLDDKLQELLDDHTIKLLHDTETIKMESTCYLRGRNLADCVVIVDESQNLTHDELVTIISRIAEQGRIWFCYDPKQSDLGNSHKSDMTKFAEIFSDVESQLEGVQNFQFGSEDIVRSKFCKFVMTKLERWEDQKPPKPIGKLITEPADVVYTLGAEEWSPNKE